MPLKCDEYGGVAVITPGSDLLADGAAELQKQIEELIETKQVVSFVIDFEKCGFIDSKGLSTLLWAKRRCEDLFGHFKLAGLDDNCRKILEITRLGHRFECHERLEAALKTMS
jgi:anti-sigma B factor antagonist